VARLLDRLSDRALRNLKPRPTPYPDGGQLYFRASAGKDEGQVNIYGEFRFATTTAERAANSGLGPERWMGLGNAGTRISKAWHPGTSLREFRQMGRMRQATPAGHRPYRRPRTGNERRKW